MKGDHFLHLVSAGKMELCVQEQSSFQEMTCFQARNGTTHMVLLPTMNNHNIIINALERQKGEHRTM